MSPGQELNLWPPPWGLWATCMGRALPQHLNCTLILLNIITFSCHEFRWCHSCLSVYSKKVLTSYWCVMIICDCGNSLFLFYFHYFWVNHFWSPSTSFSKWFPWILSRFSWQSRCNWVGFERQPCSHTAHMYSAPFPPAIKTTTQRQAPLHFLWL